MNNGMDYLVDDHKPNDPSDQRISSRINVPVHIRMCPQKRQYNRSDEADWQSQQLGYPWGWLSDWSPSLLLWQEVPILWYFPEA